MMRRRYGGMSNTDSNSGNAIQSAFIPRCLYCSSQMTGALKDTLTKDHFAIFECKDCGWEVAFPLVNELDPRQSAISS